MFSCVRYTTRFPPCTLCPLWLKPLALGEISPRSFLHHCLQRHMTFSRNSPAILIFGRVIGYSAVHARDLDAHLAPGCTDILPTPRQNLPRLVAPSYPQGCRFGEAQ